MFEREHDQGRFSESGGVAGRMSYDLDIPVYGAGTETAEPRVARRPARSLLKRVLDLAISIPAFIILSPVMAAIALIVWLTDGGAPVFVQSRYGKNGKAFRFYKFRSMRVDADERLQALLKRDPEAAEEWSSQRKLRKDPRITPFGDFIRTWSLDELPQLVNIIRGEMSLVGPRPLVQHDSPDLDDRTLYGAEFRYYLMARPGLTGLWQVSGRASTQFDERVARDIEYVSQWSVWADMKILAKTVPAVLMRQGAL